MSNETESQYDETKKEMILQNEDIEAFENFYKYFKQEDKLKPDYQRLTKKFREDRENFSVDDFQLWKESMVDSLIAMEHQLKGDEAWKMVHEKLEQFLFNAQLRRSIDTDIVNSEES